MASFRDLPEEILVQIFGNFEWQGHQLRELSLISTKTRGPAKEILYRSINISELGISRIVPLLESLFDQPELCVKVQNVRIYLLSHPLGSMECSCDNPHSHSPRCKDFVRKCNRRVNALGNLGFASDQIKNTWLDCLKKRYQAAFAGVLLLLLQNLVSLDVRMLESTSNSPTSDIRDSNSTLIHLFSIPRVQLQPDTIILSLGSLSRVTHLCIHTTRCLLTLHFPHLQILETDTIKRSANTQLRGYPSLKTLIVRHDPYSQRNGRKPPFANLARFIGWIGCSNLISVQFLMSYGPAYDRRDSQNCINLVAGLANISASLEHLKVDIIGPYKDDVYETHDSIWISNNMTPIASLRNFKNLRKLDIVQHALIKHCPIEDDQADQRLSTFKELPLYQHGITVPEYGDQSLLSAILPASLEILTIYWPNEDIIEWLEDLYENIDSVNLKKVNLCCRALPGGKSAAWFLRQKFAVFEDLARCNVTVQIYREDVVLKWAIPDEPDWWNNDDSAFR